MTKTITQKVVFKNTTPKALYDLYMDAKKHSQSTGAMAKIEAKEGTKFTAYDNYISGKNLHLIKDKLIVQSWRGSDWAKGDMDSTFIINLESKGNDTILHVTHANLPEKQADDIKKGWADFYWLPWKKHLAGKPATKANKM
jgi:activator of HSP90 ATPase